MVGISAWLPSSLTIVLFSDAKGSRELLNKGKPSPELEVALAAAAALVVAALPEGGVLDPAPTADWLALDCALDPEEEPETGALVVALLLPVAEEPLADAVPKGVLAAPGAQVAAEGRFVMP
ncbi:hypothetical protein B0A55_06741 [Friedmanniomyces simplex]|uniref:Uncharacterized protein n=1 Tax=Friedmanniomyces simplex TaxID=329884 RepID=A0A4U0X1Z6_9PEZI|nr:hypothetical protein B0A55_06741 [Friedmanniomyces simplex]